MTSRLLTLLIVLVAISGRAQNSKETQVLHSISSCGIQKTIELDSQADSLREAITDQVMQVNDSIVGKQNQTSLQINELKDVLPKPYTRHNVKKLRDSLTTSLQNISQKVSNPREPITQKELDLVKNAVDKIENHIEGSAEKHQNRLGEISELTGDQIETPDLPNLPGNDLQLPQKDLQVPGVNIPKLDLPNINGEVPKLNLPKTNDLKFPDGVVDVNNISNKANLKLPETGDFDKVKNITGEVEQAQGKIADADKYKEEVDKIKESGLSETEKLPETIEEKATNLEQVKPVSEELQKTTAKQLEYETMLQRYRDKKLIQEEMERKVKNVANEKMVEFAPAVQKAQDQLAKAKKVSPFRQKMKDIVHSSHNSMKDKPLYERIVPGVTFQVYNNDKFMVDIGSQIGYRISTRLTAGIGGTYRISAGKQNPNFLSNEGVYGYRTYADFTIFKSIFVHGEFESLRLDPDRKPHLNETFNTRVYGSYFGLGKRYNISPKLKGSILALYRVEYKGDLPGISKVNLRMGFDFNTKKKRKIKLEK